MSWGMVGAAAVSVVGGVMQGNAADKAASKQNAAAQAGIDSQERMFDKSLEMQAPYREAGYNALSGLEGLTSAEGRATALDDYYNSAEFATMNAQNEEQQLRNAAATGGVRGGNNQAAMAAIAPQMGQNFLNNQYNQLTGLANMGMGAASQGAGAANQLGASMNQTQQNIGMNNASNELAQGNINANTIGTLGGLFGDYMNGSGG